MASFFPPLSELFSCDFYAFVIVQKYLLKSDVIKTELHP